MKWYDCKTDEGQFGSHSGEQYRSRNYMMCGCDSGKCEGHAIQSMKLSPPAFFGPKYELGKPRKCRTRRCVTKKSK